MKDYMYWWWINEILISRCKWGLYKLNRVGEVKNIDLISLWVFENKKKSSLYMWIKYYLFFR